MRNQENITPIDQYVIDFVRELRDKKEMTQQDIAAIIRVSRSYIRDIESANSRAKYNIRHINALADYFGMSPRAFFPEKPLPLHYPGREKADDATSKRTLPKKKTPTGEKGATKKTSRKKK